MSRAPEPRPDGAMGLWIAAHARIGESVRGADECGRRRADPHHARHLRRRAQQLCREGVQAHTVCGEVTHVGEVVDIPRSGLGLVIRRRSRSAARREVRGLCVEVLSHSSAVIAPVKTADLIPVAGLAEARRVGAPHSFRVGVPRPREVHGAVRRRAGDDGDAEEDAH